MAISAKNLLNGTFGTLTYNGVAVSECLSCKAKVEFDKETVDIPGQLMTDTHVIGAGGTGSLELYRTSSQFSTGYLADALAGLDPRCTLISKVTSKTTGDTERIQLTGVSFDDATLADWAQKTLQKITIPFTFSGYSVLDEIEY